MNEVTWTLAMTMERSNTPIQQSSNDSYSEENYNSVVAKFVKQQFSPRANDFSYLRVLPRVICVGPLINRLPSSLCCCRRRHRRP